jgi:hypothetical protein
VGCHVRASGVFLLDDVEHRHLLTVSMTHAGGNPPALERCCTVVATALSEGRRGGVRLVSGDKREFGLSPSRNEVQVPYPLPVWCTQRLTTCALAVQCAPSKDLIAAVDKHA